METLFSEPFTLVMLAVLAVLVVFMFRGSKKRQAAARELQENMKPGVEVMLQSGVYGEIVSIDSERNRVTVQSGPGTILIVHRNAIAQLVTDDQTPSADSKSVSGDSEADK